MFYVCDFMRVFRYPENQKKSNTYPVKIRVTFDRKPQEYQTVFDLTNEDYNKLAATSRLSDRLYSGSSWSHQHQNHRKLSRQF
jgi:hypothetical protein